MYLVLSGEGNSDLGLFCQFNNEFIAGSMYYIVDKIIEQKFENEVAIIPNPKSEAWLICALKNTPYQNCKKLENRSGNDDSPNNLKDELKSFGISNDEINDMIKDGKIDIDKIKMPSFQKFVNSLKNLL